MGKGLLFLLRLTAGIIFIPLLVWVCGFIVFVGTVSALEVPQDIKPTEGIIVLTGGTNRLPAALDLLAAHKADVMLISGVHKDVKLKELLKLWGYKKRLPDKYITLGFEADHTLGNAIEARKWIEQYHIKSARIVTSTYHIPRTMMEFSHIIPDATLIAYPVKPDDFSPKTKAFWRISLLEYNKLLASLVRIIIFPKTTSPIPPAVQN